MDFNLLKFAVDYKSKVIIILTLEVFFTYESINSADGWCCFLRCRPCRFTSEIYFPFNWLFGFMFFLAGLFELNFSTLNHFKFYFLIHLLPCFVFFFKKEKIAILAKSPKSKDLLQKISKYFSHEKQD